MLCRRPKSHGSRAKEDRTKGTACPRRTEEGLHTLKYKQVSLHVINRSVSVLLDRREVCTLPHHVWRLMLSRWACGMYAFNELVFSERWCCSSPTSGDWLCGQWKYPLCNFCIMEREMWNRDSSSKHRSMTYVDFHGMWQCASWCDSRLKHSEGSLTLVLMECETAIWSCWIQLHNSAVVSLFCACQLKNPDKSTVFTQIESAESSRLHLFRCLILSSFGIRDCHTYWSSVYSMVWLCGWRRVQIRIVSLYWWCLQ